MQKTLIDPFELASVLLPAVRAPSPANHTLGQSRPSSELLDIPIVFAGSQEEPVETRVQPNLVPRGEAWARVRCWCSEE